MILRNFPQIHLFGKILTHGSMEDCCKCSCFVFCFLFCFCVLFCFCHLPLFCVFVVILYVLFCFCLFLFFVFVLSCFVCYRSYIYTTYSRQRYPIGMRGKCGCRYCFPFYGRCCFVIILKSLVDAWHFTCLRGCHGRFFASFLFYISRYNLKTTYVNIA